MASSATPPPRARSPRSVRASDPAKPRFDAVLAYASAHELDARLVGDRLRRVRQLSSDVYLFTFWGQGERDVIVSLASGSARIHLVDGDYGHADTPSAFCMLLRKHLEGMRLARVATPSLERVVLLDFSSPHVPDRRLVVELLPSLRSLVLLDENGATIGDLRRMRRKGEPWRLLATPAEIAAARAESPSPPPRGKSAPAPSKATPPEAAPPDRPSALEISGPDLVARLQAGSGPEETDLARLVVRATFGIGTSYARRIIRDAGMDAEAGLSALRADPEAPDRLAAAWDAFWRPLAAGDLESLRGAHASIGARLEEAFASGSDEATLGEERDRLATGVERHRERVLRRIEAQESDLREARDADKWRHWGDLLMAHLYRVKPRATSVVVEDYEQPDAPSVEIPLDADLSGPENAQRLYARYKKSRRGEEAIQEALGRSRLELDYWENLLAAIRTARDRDELRELALDLAAHKRRRTEGGTRKKRPRTPAARPRRYRAEGWEVLVGRNPRQNETLTMKQAAAEDWWLHARQIPGAHVILRRTGGGRAEPPDALLEAAARLAACFSGAAADTRVPIDYTRVRYVKKPPATPPGYVTYSHEKTVTVEPDLDAALKVVQAT